MENNIKAVSVEYYVALLPFKPKRWVTYHRTLEDAINLVEVYMSAEAGI